ncbi:hypothetical protein WJX84_007511 [Apatococcus fuscideae]|uniref:Nucleoporin NDC1 n=1 Tax=Apatococcus fuscideae TaxID=2026836 RepID=A0AAW1SR59_9CHLO
MSDLSKLRTDLWIWRLVAVSVWQAAALLFSSLVCKSLGSLLISRSWGFGSALGALGSSLTSVLLLESLQISAIWSHALVYKAQVPEPTVKGPGKTKSFTSNVAKPVRASRLKYYRAQTATSLGCLISALLTILSERWLRGPLQPAVLQGQAWLAGLVLGLVHIISRLSRRRLALMFPVVQRGRRRRLIQHLPAVLERMGGEVTWACLLAWLLAVVLGMRPAWPLSPTGRGLLFSSLLWSFAINLGEELLEIIFTERLHIVRASDPESTSQLLLALQAQQEPVLQEAAFLELRLLTQQPGAAAWRKREVFADDSGAAWHVIAQVCLDQVFAMSQALADSLPAAASAATKPMNHQSPAAWNAPPTALPKAAPAAGPGQRRAAWRLQVAGQRTGFAASALAALAAASRTEDAYGVAQLAEQPSLGHVIAGLADLTVLLGHFLKSPTGMGPPSRLVALFRGQGTGERHGAEAAAQRLHDVTKQALGLIYSSLGTESIKWGAISLQQLVSAQERFNVLGSFCT